MPFRETLLLHPDRPLRLDAARHVQLRVDTGIVWITASGMAGDLFLSAGESYRVPRAGKVLVEAVRGVAGVRLESTAPAHKLTVVTRNVGDFKRFSVPVLNPFR